jgi:arylsulfatase A-like enzyme
MKTRQSLMALMILCCLLLSGCGREKNGTAGRRSAKPNFVIIFVDDMGYGDLGCYGSLTIRTPRIDQLAKEGTRFMDFYVQPVCGPSRSALLTGRYPFRSGGWGMPGSEVTLAELLKGAGYTTGCIGKWDCSSRRDIPGRVPNDQGFDHYWGPLGANDRGVVYLWDNRDSIGADSSMAGLTRTYTDKAIAFVEENRDRPFLLYLAHTMVHVVVDASPAFKGRSGQGLYGDALEELDFHAGRLLDRIDELGLRENTLVILTSDNGPWCNDRERQRRKNHGALAWGFAGPLRDGKGSTWEGGMRVPCIVRWPGHVPSNAVNRAIFSSVDLMPTFATLAGYEVPSDRVIDGIDQTDLILGRNEAGKRDHLHYFSNDYLHGVRQGQWKLLLPGRRGYRDYVDDRGTDGIELYNLERDVGESCNVAASYPEIVQQLQILAGQLEGYRDPFNQ